MGKNKEVLDAELWVILKALIIAIKEIDSTKIPITLFCDSPKAFSAIWHAQLQWNNRYIGSLIYDTARKLQEKGPLLEISWDPAHSNIDRNDQAHQAAKNRSENRGKPAKNGSLVGYIKKNLRDIYFKELVSWHERNT